MALARGGPKAGVEVRGVRVAPEQEQLALAAVDAVGAERARALPRLQKAVALPVAVLVVEHDRAQLLQLDRQPAG